MEKGAFLGYLSYSVAQTNDFEYLINIQAVYILYNKVLWIKVINSFINFESERAIHNQLSINWIKPIEYINKKRLCVY